MNLKPGFSDDSIHYAIVLSARNVCGPREGLGDCCDAFSNEQLRGFVQKYQQLCRTQPDIYGTRGMTDEAFAQTLARLA